MKIKWNKVTTLSKVLSVIVFIGIVPALSFWIGREYQAVHSISTESVDYRIKLLNEVYKGKIVDVEGGKKGIQSKPESKDREGIITTIIANARGSAANEEWVLTQTNDCGEYHLCSPQLGGVIFAEVNGELLIKKIDKGLESLGESGNINTPKVISIGDTIPAFQIRDSRGNQGHFKGKLILYTVINGEFKKVLNISDASVSGGEGEIDEYYGYTTDLKFTPNPNSIYYDIAAETVGTDKVEGKIIPVKKVGLYSFNGAEYVLSN